jgi:hypothetical protein
MISDPGGARLNLNSQSAGEPLIGINTNATFYSGGYQGK